MEEEIKAPYNVYFIADLHIAHKNIIKYQRNRIEAMGLKDDEDLETHDKYILDMWNRTLKRGDHVYVLGDFVMTKGNTDWARKIFHHLKTCGCHIHLIVGNHDAVALKFPDMFESIDYVKLVKFKKNVFPFLHDNFHVVMCHYPMLTWEGKCGGSAMLHGHSHINSPWENDCEDLRINVGFDTPFANYGLIPLEKLYGWYLYKLGGLKPHEYIDKCTNENPKFIR